MGYYINPPDMEKERFLAIYGSPITDSQAKTHSAGDNGKLIVCLVDNGPFTAAGIAYDDRERDAFLRPDLRAKKWFLVDKVILEPYI